MAKINPATVITTNVVCDVCATSVAIPIRLVIDVYPSDIPANIIDVSATLMPDPSTLRTHMLTHQSPVDTEVKPGTTKTSTK